MCLPCQQTALSNEELKPFNHSLHSNQSPLTKHDHFTLQNTGVADLLLPLIS